MNVERLIVDVLKMEIAKVVTGLSEQDIYKAIDELVGKGYTSISQFDRNIEKWLLDLVKVSIPYAAEFLYVLMIQIAKSEGIIK